MALEAIGLEEQGAAVGLGDGALREGRASQVYGGGPMPAAYTATEGEPSRPKPFLLRIPPIRL